MFVVDKENYVLPTHCTLLLKLRRESVCRLSAQRRLAGHDRKGLWTPLYSLHWLPRFPWRRMRTPFIAPETV